VNLALASAPPPASASDVNQFLVTPDSSRVVITSKTTGNIVIYNLQTGTLQPTVTLGNSATLNNGGAGFKGDISADSTTFYVAANDLNVHAIDLTGTSSTPDNILIPSTLLTANSFADANGNAVAPDFVVVQN
jgi:hypothetical protein